MYKPLERPIYNVVYRSLWSSESAHELVQEAFVRLWKMRTRVQPDTADALVWKIALNLTSKRKRWLRIRQFCGVEDQTAEDLSADSAMAAHADRARVRAAVQELPDKLRDVVMLTAFSELSYAQVGELVGVPAGTVGSRRNQALAMLRDRLGDTDARRF